MEITEAALLVSSDNKVTMRLGRALKKKTRKKTSLDIGTIDGEERKIGGDGEKNPEKKHHKDIIPKSHWSIVTSYIELLHLYHGGIHRGTLPDP